MGPTRWLAGVMTSVQYQVKGRREPTPEGCILHTHMGVESVRTPVHTHTCARAKTHTHHKLTNEPVNSKRKKQQYNPVMRPYNPNRRLRKVDYKFKACLGYTTRSRLV